MKNEYVEQFLNSNDEINKGECSILESENNWVCGIDYVEYNALREENWSRNKKSSKSLVKFDLKENKLVIPDKYYLLIAVGYKIKTKRSGKHSYTETIYNKQCMIHSEGYISCTCKDLDDLGIVTFYFQGGQKLDIDLRDYAHYNENARFKCRLDVLLSFNDEFIIGLKGLNNTILSFDMEDKKIYFFHKKKAIGFTDWSLIIIIILTILYIILSMLKEQ